MRSYKRIYSSLALALSLRLGTALTSINALTTWQDSPRGILAFNSRASSPSLVQMASSSDFEDFSSDKDSRDEGQVLAKQFYQQVQKREAAKRDQEEQYDVTPVPKKFTGRRGEIDSTGTPSAGLFAKGNGNGSVYAFPVERQGGAGRSSRPAAFSSSSGADVLSPRDRMMRDEINFMRVASNEGTILLQGILVLVLLGFTLYIGSTGGITDGSERFGTMEGMINEFNGLGDSIDFSSLVNDDAATSTAVAADVVKEGSVWL
mmetsp:Transcript_19094/g.28256  ORF Transcript_19094/g.28256 Transcript_19094/m.28256 type:complete len:262 (-) Transcript_19094:187-972(-)